MFHRSNCTRVLCVMRETSLFSASAQQKLSNSRLNMMRPLLNHGNKPSSFNVSDDFRRNVISRFRRHVRGFGICSRHSKALSFNTLIPILSKFLKSLIIVLKQRTICSLTCILMFRDLRNFRDDGSEHKLVE